jgi:hypothetical protein
MFDFVENPAYLLIPLAVGFFTRGPVRLWFGVTLIFSPVLLWLGVDGSAATKVERAMVPFMLLTAALIGVGAFLGRFNSDARA